MKNILLIGQLTDMSGYGNAVRCYLENLIDLETQGLINLKVLNYSFEEKISCSDEELKEIQKRSLTKNLSYPRGVCKDEEEFKRIQKFIDKKDYEVIACLIPGTSSFGEDNGSSKFVFSAPNRPDHSGPMFNLRQICKNSLGVYQCIAWESEQIPPQWTAALKDPESNIKKLICACPWNEAVFSKLGIEAMTIPYSVKFEDQYDEEYYNKIKAATDGKFVFSSIFQWSERKGVDVLIKAFSLEFAANPNVCLILKTYLNKALKGAPKNEIEMFKDMINNINSGLLHYGQKFIPKFKTIIVNDILTKKQINSIYKASDAFILPTRGEGFCLPVAESISYKVPAIVPSIGGHTGYMDTSEANPFLIESRLEPCEGLKHPLWSSVSSEWVEPSLKSTREKIKLAYDNRENCKIQGQAQYDKMKSYLSKERCNSLFKECLFD